MKIAVLSDFHLGAKSGTQREDDSFDQAQSAIEKALNLGAQLILIAGDIFDSRIPEQEVLSKAMKILTLASERPNKQVELLDTINKNRDEISALPIRGVPVIAVHGNHERRGRGFIDSVETLESAGLAIRLHHNSVVFGTNEGEIAIHGMGYVPEEYALDVLDKWEPKPVKNAKNIFMIHQGLGKFTFSLEKESVLQPSDVPLGFDLYISGHVHYQAESKINHAPLLFPGSTIRTQLLPIEAEKSKGFYMLDVDSDEIHYKFIELGSVRDFFYKEKEFDSALPNQVEEWIKMELDELSKKARKNQDKLPLVRFRLKGTLAKGSSRSEIDINSIKSDYEAMFLLSFSYNDLNSPRLEEKTRFLKDIREERISMEERGMKILESNLEELEYDGLFECRTLFEILSEERVDEAFGEVSKKLRKMINREFEDTNDNKS